MTSSRFAVSEIRNKQKREDVHRSRKRQATQDKLKRRLERATREKDDPEAAMARRKEHFPKTLENMREDHPAVLIANSVPLPDQPASGATTLNIECADLESDPFNSAIDLEAVPKILVTTSKRATRATYEFCEDLTAVFPGADFVRRKAKGAGFELGRIAEWSTRRGYTAIIVVNEDRKESDALTVVHLPDGPTAYFKLTSIQLSKEISGHARETAHFPELVLNNFATRLGHVVGRMFQSLFPPLPEFEGRQVVTLHNQRDFLFFRRHRYMFKSLEKTSLQEIGPRFTLKMRWLKKGIPAGSHFGPAPSDIQIPPHTTAPETEERDDQLIRNPTSGSLEDEYEWQWDATKRRSRRRFSL